MNDVLHAARPACHSAFHEYVKRAVPDAAPAWSEVPGRCRGVVTSRTRPAVCCYLWRGCVVIWGKLCTRWKPIFLKQEREQMQRTINECNSRLCEISESALIWVESDSSTCAGITYKSHCRLARGVKVWCMVCRTSNQEGDLYSFLPPSTPNRHQRM